MMKNNWKQFQMGVKHGIPIALGYLAVSFSFGIMARGSGLGILQAAVMSLTNVTSAGQFAALAIIQNGAPLMEMAITQLIVNLRYCLMSCALSQKLGPDIPVLHRFLMAYGVTDEIFGVSVCRPGELHPCYSYGLIAAAVPGWTLGTVLGAVSGNLMPGNLLSALSVALYGMFLASVIPPAKGNRILMGVILVSMAASFGFTLIPVLNGISSGFKIIILTVVIAGIAAFLFPIKEETYES